MAEHALRTAATTLQATVASIVWRDWRQQQRLLGYHQLNRHREPRALVMLAAQLSRVLDGFGEREFIGHAGPPLANASTSRPFFDQGYLACVWEEKQESRGCQV